MPGVLFLLIFIALVIGLIFYNFVIGQELNIDGGILPTACMLLYFVYIRCGCISLLATDILLRKVRKDGAIKDVKSVRTVIKIQVFTALMVAAPYVFTCLIIPLEMIRNIFQNF